MVDRLCLLSVHAHPDDESSKGAGTVAKYHAEGIFTVLVSCTGGEEGDVLNPAMDLPEVRANLPAIRRRELELATKIIGYDEVVLLGYRDSGMPDTAANADPRSFAQAPLDEAVGRLVEVIRRVRPQVIITYQQDQRQYPHPDHLRVHEISVAAFTAAGDPRRYPEAGEPFQPLKLYYSVFSADEFRARHKALVEHGLPSPFAERLERHTKGDREHLRPTAHVALGEFAGVRRDALIAHATQIDPTTPHWFGLPAETELELHPADTFYLAANLLGPIEDEDDLFAGLRQPRHRSGA